VVGDFTNPVLRPHAAEVVKKNGELELVSGVFLKTKADNPRSKKPIV